MNTTPLRAATLRTLLVLCALPALSACLVVDDEPFPRRDRVIVEEEVIVVDEGPVVVDDVIVEDEVIVVDDVIVEDEVVVIEDEIIVEPFVPVSAGIVAETLDRDAGFLTSWQLYTMDFAADDTGEVCSMDPLNPFQGTTARVQLHGYEVDDAFAACPEGTYVIRPHCTLGEGEACMELHLRDNFGRGVGLEPSHGGQIRISLEPARFVGEPHLCHVSTFVPGLPEHNFDYTLVVEDYDLAPHRSGASDLCVVGQPF